MASIQWDKQNSSYWWRMDMDTNNPKNNPNVKHLVGYSKAEGQAEAISKINCFCAKVEMLVKHGYIYRAKQIVVYEKVGAYPSEQQDRALVILTANDYRINPELIDKINSDIKLFLKNLYDHILERRAVKYMKPRQPQPIKDDVLYDTQKQFKNISEITTYCDKLLAGGENRSMVIAYFKKMIDRFDTGNVNLKGLY